MVDGGKPGIDSRDEGKHTGRNCEEAELLNKKTVYSACFNNAPKKPNDVIIPLLQANHDEKNFSCIQNHHHHSPIYDA